MTPMELFHQALSLGASDIHLSAGCPVSFRILGELRMQGTPLTPSFIEDLVEQLCSPSHRHSLDTLGEAEFAVTALEGGRFRCSVYRQRGTFSVAIRVLPSHIPTIDNLALPQSLKEIVSAREGLLLVTGPTGSGKSSTLAALVNHLNSTVRRHIICLEEPIEYEHVSVLSIIDQREIGVDTFRIDHALRAVLRQDPDVIVVGEIRDTKTMRAVLTAAETGHLVMATLHTGDAVQTIERIIDFFSAHHQQQIRQQLANVLVGVVSQRLCKATQGRGRLPAIEILVNNSAVSNLIRADKLHQIRSLMQTSRLLGMQTLDWHIAQLISAGAILEVPL